MKLRWITRTSLFARMSLLFGLLVTVPLVISGIVLSMVGWNSVHQSGREVAGIGRDVLGQTKTSFREIARQTLDDATGKVAEEGNKRLDQTTGKAMKTGREVLEQSARQMSEQGKNTVGRATSGMATIGQQTLRQSLGDLRKVNLDSLDKLQDNFIDQTQKELADRSSPVKENLRATLRETWKVSADRRALSIDDHVKKLQFMIVRSLQYPLQTVAVHNGDPKDADQVRQWFETFVRKDSPEVVRVVLVSPTGTEVARVPQTEPEEDWADASKNPTRALFFSKRRMVPYAVEPVRWEERTNASGERSGRWIQRLVHQVVPTETPPSPADATPPEMADAKMAMTAPTSFIVVDIALGSIVVDANAGLPEGMEIDVIHTDSKRIISSSDRAKVNEVSTTLAAALPSGDEASKYVDKPFPFDYVTPPGPPQGVPMQGLGRYWANDQCWTVVLQPTRSVMQPVRGLDEDIKQAAESALTRVKEKGAQFINHRNQLAATRVQTSSRLPRT